jgi:hypothetical protein
MFLRATIRKKDGKEHRYFSVVENKRVSDGRVMQRHVLYLGEINDSQELAWRKSIAVFEGGAARPRMLALFPEDRCAEVADDGSIVRLKLKQLRLVRPRAFGACWLALRLWQELRLDRQLAARLVADMRHRRHRDGAAVKATQDAALGQVGEILADGLRRQIEAAGELVDVEPAFRLGQGHDLGLARGQRLHPQPSFWASLFRHAEHSKPPNG